ncbi:MAG: hypothetical protein IKU82_04900 [Clostridia bacterium]|nr:hypothetical protein [Clostridia bacterium]
MKKVIAIFMVLVMLFVCGCSAKVPKGDKSTLLINARWQGHDGACENKIIFGADNYFSNSCICGEPVGDADVVETYSYNKEKQTLSLYDDKAKVIESGRVMFLDQCYLVVDLWDDVYVYENQKGHKCTVYDEVKQYVLDDFTKPFINVLKFEDGVLTVTSHDYDGDTPDLFEKWELTVADDVSFKEVSVTDNKGEVSAIRRVLTEEDYQYIGEYYTAGYFTFNEDGQVTDIVFYGELVIQ